MSILISVNPPYAGLLVDGEKTIEWRKTSFPFGKAYIYETKKGGGSGLVIGEVEIAGAHLVDPNRRIKDFVITAGCVTRDFLQQYAGGKPIWANFCINAKRYENPISLSDFERPCPYKNNCIFCKYVDYGGQFEPPSCNYTDTMIIRAPQSWCYVEKN